MTTASYTAAHMSTFPAWVRLLLRACFVVLVLFVADALLSHGNEEEGTPVETISETTPEESAGERSESGRLREGTNLVSEPGSFKMAGDRAVFVSAATGKSLVGLENLNLARVVNLVRDTPDTQWSVSGTITEYRGANYLLITRAVRKTAPAEAVKVRSIKLTPSKNLLNE